MTAQDATLETPAAVAERPPHRTRPFLWSLRRELWENRAIFFAPAALAAVVLLGLVIAAVNAHHGVGGDVEGLQGNARTALIVAIPFLITAVIITVTAIVTGFFYCLGALQGERRDRSILFWKSLPVSDLTAVGAKAAVALVVLPIITFLVVALTQLVIMAASFVVLPAHGLPATLALNNFPLIDGWLSFAIIMACMSLWYAPVWAWCLMISGWARRVAFLWAVGPPLALVVFERIAFQTRFLEQALNDRLKGGLIELFDRRYDATTKLDIGPGQLDLTAFFMSPSLWIGLVVAVAFFAVAVWQRRYRSPL